MIVIGTPTTEFKIVCFSTHMNNYLLHVCGRPLERKWEDECVIKFSELSGSNDTRLGKRGGQVATSKKRKLFDCTMGFEGEDPATRLLHNTFRLRLS